MVKTKKKWFVGEGYISDYSRVKNISEALNKITEEISNGDWKKLDDIERCLAVLMRDIREGYAEIHNFPFSNRIERLAKQLKFWDEYGLADHGTIFDHTYKQKIGDVEFLISEPYNLTLTSLKKIIEHCEKNNVGLFIDGNAKHFTGRTLRLGFCKREKKEERKKDE